jgi:hypothetical protein
MNVFLDIKYTLVNNSRYLATLAAISEDDDKFYAEFKDCVSDTNNINMQILTNHKFKDPLENEDDYWIHSKPHSMDMRGNKREVAIYLYDWLHELLGGPVSWVDYSEKSGGPGYRNIKPLVDDDHIDIWVDNICVKWKLFEVLWRNTDKGFPPFVHPFPYDMHSILKVNYAPCRNFSDGTHNPIGSARAMREIYITLTERNENERRKNI